MLARKKTMQMARVTMVFLDRSLPGADSTTKVDTDSIMHMEESSPSVHSMKKKRALHSWGSGRVLTLKSFSQPSFSEYLVLTSDQVRVGDEGQSWSTCDNILNILAEKISQVAEGAKDSKAGHKRCEAVGDADEEDVEDNVLVQVMLLHKLCISK